MSDASEKVRKICARLLDGPIVSATFESCRSELKAASAELVREQTQWNKPPESDRHQDEARQSCREMECSDGFAEEAKILSPKQPEPEEKKD